MDNLTSLYTDPTAMEPLTPLDTSGELEKLSIKLIKASAKLSSSIHKTTREAIADFLRPMNSYYSNLIEGHDTHPIDIDKALKGDFSTDKKKRDYQKEAKAHITLHKYICEHIKDANTDITPLSNEYIKLIHKKFYENLPEDFKIVTTKEGEKKEIIPGEFRTSEVIVGRHIAPSHSHLNSFMDRFEEVYLPNKSPINRIISIAASHHRLAWIHPFIDGNGRVVRLFSDAFFAYEDLDSGGLWSISRGLARKNDDYIARLANADMDRQGDYDGRGNLSNRNLIEFCKFFLETAIDQIEYMSSILDTDTIINRIEGLTELLVIKKNIKPVSKHILIDLFLKGEISKSDVMRITNTSDKTAKLITDSLEKIGLLITKNEKGKKAYYQPNYPLQYSPSIFPGLYPSAKEIDLINNNT
jgi:Fic family protein